MPWACRNRGLCAQRKCFARTVLSQGQAVLRTLQSAEEQQSVQSRPAEGKAARCTRETVFSRSRSRAVHKGALRRMPQKGMAGCNNVNENSTLQPADGHIGKLHFVLRNSFSLSAQPTGSKGAGNRAARLFCSLVQGSGIMPSVLPVAKCPHGDYRCSKNDRTCGLATPLPGSAGSLFRHSSHRQHPLLPVDTGV